MLVLSRRSGQSVTLQIPPCTTTQEVVISLAEVHQAAARMGFEAPQAIVIKRTELLQEGTDPDESR